MPEFIALDGEGLTREDGSHDYVLLASSTGSCVEQWQFGGLSTRQCFDYLLSVSVNHPDAVFIGFSFGYDINMMLRDMPRSDLKRLHENNSVDWIPEQGQRFWMKFIPNKWFELSYFEFDTVHNKWPKAKARIKIWDVFGFFQMSFIRALEDWKVGAASQEFIAEMKLRRGKFDAQDAEEIKRYCFEEVKYLVEMGNLLQESMDDAGIDCKQYHGAGAIANTLLRSHSAKDFILQRPANDMLWDAILRSYFGGRIETFVAGFVPEPVYDYDINSAYPNAIRKLPDLASAHWARTRNYDPNREYALWRVSWELGPDARIAPFPYRDASGNIYYVRKGEGWYHAPEVRSAYNAGLPIRIHEGITCTPSSDAQPFKWVEEIYYERQQAKARGDKREKVLKLGLNSLYGKFAQAISGKDKAGPFQCFFYAGYITSYCRGMLLAAAMQAPDGILAFATDGILSLNKLDLDFGKELGQWENKTVVEDGLLFVQPGLVVSRYESFVRTRGVDRSAIGFDTFYNAWLEHGFSAKVTARDTRFISLGRALQHGGDKALMNEVWRRWVSHDTEITFFPARKWPLEWKTDTYCKLDLRAGFEGMSGPYQKGLEIDHQEMEPVDFLDSLFVST